MDATERSLPIPCLVVAWIGLSEANAQTTRNREPDWSPDGSQITFFSYRDGNFEVYVMNADGTDQRNLTNNPAIDGRPSWSPNGEKIAFYSTRYAEQEEIFVMNADGSKPTRLTDGPN